MRFSLRQYLPFPPVNLRNCFAFNTRFGENVHFGTRTFSQMLLFLFWSPTFSRRGAVACPAAEMLLLQPTCCQRRRSSVWSLQSPKESFHFLNRAECGGRTHWARLRGPIRCLHGLLWVLNLLLLENKRSLCVESDQSTMFSGKQACLLTRWLASPFSPARAGLRQRPSLCGS